MVSPPSLRDMAPLPTGHLRLQVFRHGELVEDWGGPNMVVVGAQQVLAALIAGAPNGGIAAIGVGTSMLAANFGNTALTQPVFKGFDSIVQPAFGKATFNFTLGAGDANGVSIGEFGLLDGNRTLFARKARTTTRILKDATMALVGSWTIDFGASA